MRSPPFGLFCLIAFICQASVKPIAPNVDLSHQETNRILELVELWYSTVASGGHEWLELGSVQQMLLFDLQYEDEGEFEASLKGTLEDWLKQFPHITMRDVDGRMCMKVEEWDPQEPRTLTFTVNSSQQLLNTTLYKAADAELDIPALGFTIQANSKRVIDSVFNHLANAILELELFSGTNGDTETVKGITTKLQRVLDVREPVTIVLKDPAGLSKFFPPDNVTLEPLNMTDFFSFVENTTIMTNCISTISSHVELLLAGLFASLAFSVTLLGIRWLRLFPKSLRGLQEALLIYPNETIVRRTK